MILTNRHLEVLEAVARGAVRQRILANNLRLRPEGRGFEWATAERELVRAGYIRPPRRLAWLLHRRCAAELTVSGWHALVGHIARTYGEAARRRAELEG